LIFFQYHYSRN